MTTSTVDPTRELAAFLRSRRERLDPDDFGLPKRRSRRTPGLRREEVAELAGISIDYVVRLEQARGIRPSVSVVEALARALRLNPDERAYLFALTRHYPRGSDDVATTAPPPLAGLVEDLSPLPAMLVNHRFDVLAWNAEMAGMLLDFSTLPAPHRNAMWLCLAHPEIREYYVDRDRVLRDGVAHLRTAWAAHPEDRALTGLIAAITEHDAEFARLWSQRDVKLNGRGGKAMRHPELGPIEVHFEVLVPVQDSGQRLMICRPADEPTRLALSRLRAS